MIPSVVVDTDVVSFMFKQDTRAALYRPRVDDKLSIVSFMTLAELDRWALEYNWGEARRRNMEVFMQDFLFSFSDRALCGKWAQAICSARRNRRPIRTADAWIAATVRLHNVPLVTHNRSNSLGVEGLTLISEAPRG